MSDQHTKKEQAALFRSLVGGSTRVTTWAITVLATVFLTLYNQLVCPFLESLDFLVELRNLLLVNAFLLVLRELLFALFPRTGPGTSPARHAFKISVVSWLAAGLFGVGLHEYLYGAEFPWHSGLKILSGYWIMGAGLIAQLDYVIFERRLRLLFPKSRGTKNFLEHIASRLVESTAVFVLMPVAAMIIMIVRYVFQDRIIPAGVALEISYLGLVFLALAIVVVLVYGRSLRRDAKEIVSALNNVEKGNFNVAVDETRSDELGAMASGINEMTRGLRQREKIREAFGRFVNPEIAREFVEKYADIKEDVRQKGEAKKVAILMCDIRGFTELSQKDAPAAVASLLNRYFSSMVKVVQDERGLVDKFIGDAIMAVFGIVGSYNPCVQAVRAAIGMRASLALLNRELEKEGRAPLDNGIGIHYGEVIAGYLGSEDRLEYTVIGPAVNLASRLCDAARKPKPAVLFSAEVRDQVQNVFKTDVAGEAELKGIGTIPLFSVKK